MKIHVVKQGESLYTISQKYGVPLDEIIKLNPGIANPNEIDVGMKVKIPSAASAPVHPPHQMEIMHQHIVKQGDTLWKLSKAWGVSLNDMIKANPQLKNPNALLVGETVNIPKESTGGKDWPELVQGQEKHPNSPAGKVSTEQIVKPKKEETAPKPLPTVVQNIPAPAAKAETAPVPVPTPLPEKVQSAEVEKKEEKEEMKKETHIHIEEAPNHDLFKKKNIPAVEALTPYPLPKTPQFISPVESHHGYTVQQHSVHVNIGPANISPNVKPNVSPANKAPNPAPNVSPSSISPKPSSYAVPSNVTPNWAPNVSPANVTPNWAPNVSPANVTPNWAPNVSPVNVTPNWAPNVSPVNVTPNWAPNVSPANVTPCWPPNVSPTSVTPNVSPSSISPNSSPNASPPGVTPNLPPNISPANIAPVYYGQEAYSSSFLSSQSPYQQEWPNTSPSDIWGSYPPFPVSPFHDGGYSFSPYEGYPYPPQTGGAGAGQSSYQTGGYGYPSMPVLHSNAGFPGFETAISPAEGWNYPGPDYHAGANLSPYPAYPVKESPAAHKKPCNCGCGDKRVEEQGSTSNVKAAVSTKRKSNKPQKKVTVRSAATSSSSSRESSRSRRNQPWINK